jgi:hypothetical protein
VLFFFDTQWATGILKSLHPLRRVGRAFTMSGEQACTSFKPNPFKPDFCKVCQKGKALHIVTETIQSSNEPCGTFTANPFKPDFCKTCQQGKHLHADVAAKGRQLYEPPDLHKPKPKPQATPAVAKPASAAPAPVKEQPKPAAPREQPKAAPAAAVPASGDEAWTGEGACDGFVANPFKQTLCKRCRLPQTDHVKPGSQDVPDPDAWNEPGTCDRFVANPFKAKLCKRCRLPQTDHSEAAQTVGAAAAATPAAAKPAAPVSSSVPKAEKPVTANPGSKPAPPPATAAAPTPTEAKPTSKPVVAAKPQDEATDCDEFKPHAFKKLQCANCGHEQSKHVKAAPAKPAESKPVEKPIEAQPVKPATLTPAVVSSAANESTPATYADCDEFKPHAFKKDKCSNCGYAKDKHRAEATPEGKELVKAPVEPPKPAAREPVAAAKTVPPKAPAKEQQPAATASAPPKPTPPAAEGPSSDTDCTDFKPHPFRKQMCANCGHTQASHTAPKAPVAAVLKPTAPAPGGTEQAGVPAPAAPPAPMETDDAACPRVRTARLQEAPV